MGRSPKDVAAYLDAFNDWMMAYGIDTIGRVAAFLPQVGHESAGLRYREELASGKAYTTREDLGNTKPEAIAYARAHGQDTGPFYKGHGFIQITGYTNHLQYSLDAYKDARCVITPKLLTLPPDVVRSACWVWKRAELSTLADAGTREMFLKITRRINGGYNGLDDRLKRWEICKEVLLISA